MTVVNRGDDQNWMSQMLGIFLRSPLKETFSDTARKRDLIDQNSSSIQVRSEVTFCCGGGVVASRGVWMYLLWKCSFVHKYWGPQDWALRLQRVSHSYLALENSGVKGGKENLA